MRGRARRQHARRRHVQAGPERYGGGYDDEWYEGGAAQDERARRLVTPARAMLLLLLLGSGAVAFYGLFFDRTRLQIPLAVSGLAVFGLCLAAAALVLARAGMNLGRAGYGKRAVTAAFFGGMCALGASGALSGAIVLGILAGST